MIADCGLRIADLTAKNAARPAATETGMGHRLTQIDTEMRKSSRKWAILTDWSAKNAESGFLFVLFVVKDFFHGRIAHFCEDVLAQRRRERREMPRNSLGNFLHCHPSEWRISAMIFY
jgi:hypothetical protein